MENYVTMLPVAASQPLIDFSDAEDAVIVEDPVVQSSVSFLDANTNAISLEELASTCVVPTWGNQDLTISHQDFINCVHDAAKDFYRGETVNDPSIRVSHIVRGRTPDALGKRASELLECEKTQFYQRMAFAFTIPTIFETINGQKLELCCGGVRNYSDLNLYRQNKGVEKVSIFVGWRVRICSNQILTGDGVKLSLEVMTVSDIYKAAMELFFNFLPIRQLNLMKTLSNTYLTETQFATLVGRMRMYQALPPRLSRSIPNLLITDSQINNVCRGFYSNPDFGGENGAISMWSFHNLMTEANKSSYIDSYLQRAVNATDVCVGLNNAMHGVEGGYSWFLS